MPRPNLTDGFNRKMKRFAIPDITALNKSSSICLNHESATSNSKRVIKKSPPKKKFKIKRKKGSIKKAEREISMSHKSSLDHFGMNMSESQRRFEKL